MHGIEQHSGEMLTQSVAKWWLLLVTDVCLLRDNVTDVVMKTTVVCLETLHIYSTQPLLTISCLKRT